MASTSSPSASASPSALLWLYGLVFFSQFKPSEPFLVDFLVQVPLRYDLFWTLWAKS
jgi:hypothetical protein